MNTIRIERAFMVGPVARKKLRIFLFSSTRGEAYNEQPSLYRATALWPFQVYLVAEWGYQVCANAQRAACSIRVAKKQLSTTNSASWRGPNRPILRNT